MPRLLAALAVLLLLVATPSAPAASAAVAAASPADEAGGQLLVIMDVSGSMERTDASGTTLINGAREAVREFVDVVPPETEIGLRLYGSDYAGDDEAAGCRDTRLAVPIGPAEGSGAAISAAIDGARPTGFTPIGFSLTEAADDFAAEGERGIVLVSDGEDTCGSPAPCAAAKKLARSGINVRVDTVGLFLQDNPAARKQLECIAEVTGGTYVPADDTRALSQQLTAVAGRAVARFQAGGEEIDGGAAQTQATPIEPGVSYVDDILNGEARWYSFDLAEGQSVSITSTDDGTADYGCCLRYEIHDASSRRAADSGYNQSGTANTYVLDAEAIGSPSEGDTATFYYAVVLDDTTSTEEYGAMEFEFTAEVSGEAVETPTESPTESITPTSSESASPSESPSTAPPADATSADSSSGVPAFLWVLLGVLVLAVLGLGVMVIALLRKVSAPRP